MFFYHRSKLLYGLTGRILEEAPRAAGLRRGGQLPGAAPEEAEGGEQPEEGP